MADRRRAPRFQVCRSTSVQIGLLQEVLVQWSSGDDVTVLTSSFPPPCERLQLQVILASGEIACLPAEVVKTAPIMDGGDVKFRLDLHVTGFAALSGLNPLELLR